MGEFRALTLDTSVIEKEAFRFDDGNLRLLRQFRGSSIQVVLSSIVVREVTSHLERDVRKLKTTLKSADKDTKRLLPELANALPSGQIDSIEPGDEERKRLSDFMSAVGAEQVGAEWGSLTDIENGYFNSAAPFTSQGTKKHEFPDAIALSALEGWAKASGKTLIAVSADTGWLDYKSEVVTVVSTIPEALKLLFPEPEDQALHFVQNHIDVLTRVADNDGSIEFFRLLKAAIDNTGFDAQAESDMGAVTDYPEMTVDDCEIHKEFSIVQAEPEQIIINMRARITGQVSVQVDFFVWDGVDKEEVPMGTEVFTREIELEDADLLVTFEGSFATDEWIVSGVEITNINHTIDLGYVEPDWRDRDNDDEPADSPEPE